MEPSPLLEDGGVPAPVPGSFRDPRARVFATDDAILRALNPAGAEDFARLESTSFYGAAQRRGTIVPTRRATGAAADRLKSEGWSEVLLHERIPVVTYPYEWSFSMLQDAALLQLQLVADGLGEGISCKDGTSYNVQFVGSQPTFIDIGSFAPLAGGDAWPGYRQFCSLFLYPLLLESYLDVSFAPWLRGSLEGMTPEVADRLLRGRARMRRGVLTHVTLQAVAARRYAEKDDPAAELASGQESNATIIEALCKRTTALVESLRAPGSATTWSDYSGRSHYGGSSLDEKDRFVREVLAEAEPTTVVDLGCNDGRYAELAAEYATSVVAIDADRRVVDQMYQRLRGRNLPILAMVGDLADPSPGLGWDLTERTPLSERLDADLSLSLALIHHLVIGRNIPIGAYLDALGAIAPRTVLEVPHRDDPMVRRMLAPKPPDTHDDYQLEVIRRLIEERFEIRRELALSSGTRTIFDLVRR
ncbi:MAG TPA: class I SAM-dependent methyltransferase [Acidimicrobiales bacterium]|nr:class I SAM-dependent methyltransferase [Acidimicrobiales bacterium]